MLLQSMGKQILDLGVLANTLGYNTSLKSTTIKSVIVQVSLKTLQL